MNSKMLKCYIHNEILCLIHADTNTRTHKHRNDCYYQQQASKNLSSSYRKCKIYKHICMYGKSFSNYLTYICFFCYTNSTNRNVGWHTVLNAKHKIYIYAYVCARDDKQRQPFCCKLQILHFQTIVIYNTIRTCNKTGKCGKFYGLRSYVSYMHVPIVYLIALL